MVLLNIEGVNVNPEGLLKISRFFERSLVFEAAKAVRNIINKDRGVTFFKDPILSGMKFVGSVIESFPGYDKGIELLTNLGLPEKEARKQMARARGMLRGVANDYHPSEMLLPHDEFVCQIDIAAITDVIKYLDGRIAEKLGPVNIKDSKFVEFTNNLLSNGLTDSDLFYRYIVDLLTKKRYSKENHPVYSDSNRIIKNLFDDPTFPPERNDERIFGVDIRAVRYLKKYFQSSDADKRIVERLRFQINRMGYLDFYDSIFTDVEGKYIRMEKRERTMDIIISKPFSSLVKGDKVSLELYELAKSPFNNYSVDVLINLKEFFANMRLKMEDKHRRQFREGLKAMFTPKVKFQDGKLTVTLLGNI